MDQSQAARVCEQPDARQPVLALEYVNQLLEEQSKRIAQAIHDEAGQLLAGILHRLDAAERELSPNCKPSLVEIRQLLNEVDAQLRLLSSDLRPLGLGELGLAPALEFLADTVSKRAGLRITIRHSGAERLPAAIENELYRVIQEALTNVARHAQARTVQIELDLRDPILCSIRDDGIGFDLNAVMSRKGARGLGLLGMRERVKLLDGTLTIRSSRGAGAEITISIPSGSSPCL